VRATVTGPGTRQRREGHTGAAQLVGAAAFEPVTSIYATGSARSPSRAAVTPSPRYHTRQAMTVTEAMKGWTVSSPEAPRS
jgi:hypothetical protein